MSGWLKGNLPKWLARWSYSRVPTAAKEAINDIDREWDRMAGKTPDKQFPAMPQSKVNQEFRKKEERVRRQSFPKR